MTGNDVVYDLGSGDGRIVIAAAKDFGARGVGIDIDPERIAEANENAKRANVTDRVKFVQGDLFESDFSAATVITLFLWPHINMKLRPQLLKLKPGHAHRLARARSRRLETGPDGEGSRQRDRARAHALSVDRAGVVVRRPVAPRASATG